MEELLKDPLVALNATADRLGKRGASIEVLIIVMHMETDKLKTKLTKV